MLVRRLVFYSLIGKDEEECLYGRFAASGGSREMERLGVAALRRII